MPDDVWRSYSAAQGLDKTRAIAICQRFFNQGQTQYPDEPVDTTMLVLESPFCPARKMVRTATWQVNDPLVHSHFGDLQFYPTDTTTNFMVPPNAPVPTNMGPASLGRMNRRYSPWGGNPELNPDPFSPTDPFAYDLSGKDPGVRSSDDWDFPNGQSPDFSWLGRVHRGTPWQTIYLKSPVADSWAWHLVSVDPATHPTNDWAIARSLALLWNTNPPQALLSINEPNPSTLAAVFEGVPVLSNVISDLALVTGAPPQFATFSMSSNSPQAAALVEAISRSRPVQPTRRFHSLAELFAIPEMTVASPWLHLGSVQSILGLNDAALEAVPREVLGRFREEDIECSLLPGDGAMTLELRVPWPGAKCGVETSTDLHEWTPGGGPYSPSNGVVLVELPPETSAGWRFYRGKLIP